MQTKKPPILCPDTLLHIYYLEGKIPANHRFERSDFLGNWEEDNFSFLFYLAPAQEEVRRLVDAFSHLTLLDEFAMTYEQWQGGAVGPVRIGRFLLNPPWQTAEPQGDEIVITLNAGVVFGNGAHPTTTDCLEAIAIACGGGKVHTMLDLGTGTGLLALAAAKLGCGRGLAVDFNYLAAQTARTNVLLNNLDQSILVVHGRAEEQVAVASDLLVANIHYQVMKEIVRSEGFLGHKWFVLSGLLNSEAKKITAYLATQPVALLKHWHHNGVWHTFLGITQT